MILKKEGIIKIFNDSTQKFTNIVIPSKLTVGASHASFQEGIATYGPVEFKTTTPPISTEGKLYASGSYLMFGGNLSSFWVDIGKRRREHNTNTFYSRVSVD